MSDHVILLSIPGLARHDLARDAESVAADRRRRSGGAGAELSLRHLARCRPT